MAALALLQQVQLVQLEEPTAAPHHTPPAPRLRLLLGVVDSAFHCLFTDVSIQFGHEVISPPTTKPTASLSPTVAWDKDTGNSDAQNGSHRPIQHAHR